MHSIVNGTAAVYLRELIQSASQVDSHPNLRSSDNCTFLKLHTAHSDKIRRTSVLYLQPSSLERTPNWTVTGPVQRYLQATS